MTAEAVEPVEAVDSTVAVDAVEVAGITVGLTVDQTVTVEAQTAMEAMNAGVEEVTAVPSTVEASVESVDAREAVEAGVSISRQHHTRLRLRVGLALAHAVESLLKVKVIPKIIP